MTKVLAVLVILTAVVHAKPKASDALAAQVKALNAGDAKAFAAQFTDQAVAFFPAAADEATGAKQIERVAKRWLDRLGKATFKVENVKLTDVMDGEAYFAELVVTAGGATTRLRITGMFALFLPPDAQEDVFKVLALDISEVADDKAVLAAAKDGKLPALPTLPTGDNLLDNEAPDKIATWAKQVDGATVVVGSAPKELAFGTAGGATLAGWKSLKLATTGAVRGSSHGAMDMAVWVAGHVEATFQVAGKSVKVPYRALLMYRYTYAAAGKPPVLASAHFSVATR